METVQVCRFEKGVDKAAEKLPTIVRAPVKFAFGGAIMAMGGSIGTGAGIVTMTNAAQDIVGKGKMPGKAT